MSEWQAVPPPSCPWACCARVLLLPCSLVVAPLTLSPAPTLPMSLVEATATLGVGPTSLFLCHIITPVPCPPCWLWCSLAPQLQGLLLGHHHSGGSPWRSTALLEHLEQNCSRRSCEWSASVESEMQAITFVFEERIGLYLWHDWINI